MFKLTPKQQDNYNLVLNMEKNININGQNNYVDCAAKMDSDKQHPYMAK